VTPAEVQSLRELAAEVVATWPPLSPEMQAELRRLLPPITRLAESHSHETSEAA
jgi:hypothetical protein